MAQKYKSAIFHYWIDIIFALTLFLFAFFLRAYNITLSPPGFHGDEAWTGIDAQRIITEGPLPVFIGSALGQPTGPLYITAFFIQLLGPTIEAVRLSMAFLGSISIPLFYLFLLTYFRRSIALWGALFFAVSLFHLHFSRIGFMLISSLVPLLLFLITLRTWQKFIPNPFYILLSGFFLGLGVYTYNTFILALPFFIAFGIATLVFTNRKKILDISIFILGILLSALPYFLFIAQNFSVMTNRFFGVKATLTPHEPFTAKLLNISTFFLGHKVDYADGFGYSYTFLAIELVLIGLGLLYAIFKKKYWWFILFILVNLSFLVLSQGSYFRRAILSLPFLYFFLTLGIAWFLSWRKYVFLPIKHAVIAIIFFIVFAYSLKQTFYVLPQSEHTKTVFISDTLATLQYAATLKPDFIVFYSKRHFCEYESIKYIHTTIICFSMRQEAQAHIESAKKLYLHPSSKGVAVFTDGFLHIPLENDPELLYLGGKNKPFGIIKPNITYSEIPY